MWLVLYIVGMQWTLAALGLSIVWHGSLHRSLRSPLAALGSAAAFSCAMAALARWRVWGAGATAYFLGVASIAWLFAAAHAASCRRARLVPVRVGWLDFPWPAGLGVIELTMLVVASRYLGEVFVYLRLGGHAVPTIPSRLLALALGVQAGAGGFLALTIAWGARHASRLVTAADGDKDAAQHYVIGQALKWVLTALVVRLMTIGFSLLILAAFDPFGYRHALLGLIEAGSTLIMTRLLLGIVLPLFLLAIGGMALGEGGARMAALQFLPMVFLVLFGEICAAALTIGNWGIAF
ncbi:MAG: hypothetical protein M1457_06785 [bacterium]|nr:hypothetical protein [bacterium]